MERSEQEREVERSEQERESNCYLRDHSHLLARAPSLFNFWANHVRR